MANFNACMKFCDTHDIPGMLISSSNTDQSDPWVMIQYFLHQTTSVSPVIVINPVYIHPFTASRIITSLSALYQRKIYINFAAGASLSDQQALGDSLSHEERYRRLDEFIHIFHALVSTRKKLSFSGKYYHVENLSLTSKLAEDYLPEFWIAGNSADAISLAEKYKSLNLQMIPHEGFPEDTSGKIYSLSVICREDPAEIESVIAGRYPSSRLGELHYQLAAGQTDSEWKELIHSQVKTPGNRLFRPESVKYSHTDNPCLAGSKKELQEFFRPLLKAGLQNLLITYYNPGDLGNFMEAIEYF